jgi:hypothetical protein
MPITTTDPVTGTGVNSYVITRVIPPAPSANEPDFLNERSSYPKIQTFNKTIALISPRTSLTSSRPKAPRTSPDESALASLLES